MNRAGTRVAIVDHVGRKAGMEAYDYGLYQGLRKVGCDVILLSNFGGRLKDENIVPLFSFSFASTALSFARLLAEYFKARKFIRSRKVDYCILHGFRFGFAEWLLLSVVRKKSIGIFLIIHDPESLLGKSTSTYFRRKIFSSCEKLIVHNQYSNKMVLEKISMDMAEKLVIIPHGNYFPSFNLWPENTVSIADSGNGILFFGQIKATKGLDLLLEAMPFVDSSVRLTIAGRMRHHSFEMYQKKLKRLGLENRVHLEVRYIQPERRAALINSALAVVLPYRKVYQSGVLLLAMSMGKAVIASDLPPNRELITDEENGFLFEAGNNRALAETINKVVNDDALRFQAGRRAYEYVSVHHDWEKIAAHWKALFTP